MKKLLLLASTAVTAALMVSCSQGTDTTTPPGPTTDGYTFTTVSDAVYYGEKYAEGSGFYTFTLSDADGNKMRIDCFGTVASNSNNPRFTTGTYEAGTLDDRTVRTFVTADSATAEEGTIFWKGSEAYPVSGGTMKVSSQGGSYKLDIEFTSGETTIKGSFDGTLKFEGKPQVPPGPLPALSVLTTANTTTMRRRPACSFSAWVTKATSPTAKM